MAHQLATPDGRRIRGLKILAIWIFLLPPAFQLRASAESHGTLKGTVTLGTLKGTVTEGDSHPESKGTVTLRKGTVTLTHGALKGTVTLKETGEPLHHVSVAIEGLDRSTVTEHDGLYEFDDVPPGTYHLVGHLDSLFAEVHTTVTVEPGKTTEADIVLELLSRRYEVTVTGREEHETVFEAFQSIESMGPYDLAESANVSVGELLDHKVGTGVAKRGFGPGASRPIIRGFDGDRILMLEDGIRTGSLASQSGDHGELINPAQLERLEIVKGPATLLYSAVTHGTLKATVTHIERDSH